MFLGKSSYPLLIVLSLGVFCSKSEALVITETPLQQTQEVANWFSGYFSNEIQYNNDPSKPLITMSNCPVTVTGGSFGSNTESIFLEQNFLTTPQAPRLRYYGFSPTMTGVLLSVYGFNDTTGLNGLCNQPTEQRTLDFSNILPNACEITLTQALDPRRYDGTNSPTGCPAASGSPVTVISTISIQSNQIISLDQGFIGATPIFGTEIVFQTVPESDFLLGIGVLGLILLKKPKI